MGTIDVTFWGICTFLKREQEGIDLPQVWGRRMVMVNADEQQISQNSALSGLDVHKTRLHILGSDILTIGALQVHDIPIGPTDDIVFHLPGVLVKIANAIDAPFVPATACLPNVADFVTSPLGPPGSAAVFGDPAIVSAFFDFTSGTLTSFLYLANNRIPPADAPAVSRLTTETDGDPRIMVTPFGTTDTTEIVLRSGSSVLITNLPDEEKGDDANGDFLLAYLLAQTFPSGFTNLPPHVSCLPPGAGDRPLDTHGLKKLRFFQTVGCTNTNWP